MMKRWIYLVAALGVAAGSRLSWDQQAAGADGAAGWGTIKGQIVWGGDAIPQRKPIATVQANQDKAHCLEKGALLDEEWVVDPATKGIKWTFVWLDLSPDDKT